MLNFEYPELLKLLKPYLAPKRNESASFLIWYLANYYRLDDVDAIDSVCDKHGDKGVDGIYMRVSWILCKRVFLALRHPILKLDIKPV